MHKEDSDLEGFPQPLFPLGYKWDLPTQPWLPSYPKGVPPGLVYSKVRTEQVVQLAAESFPNRPAILFYRSTWTYAELLGHVRRVAAGFKAMGIGPGDRVLFVLPNCPEFVICWFALHWIGAEVVHGSPLNSAAELAKYAEVSKPKAVLGLDVRLETCVELTKLFPLPWLIVVSLAPHLPAHLRAAYRFKNLLSGRYKVAPGTKVHKFAELERMANAPIGAPYTEDVDLPAVMQPTGGTTGGSKLAVLTHNNLICNIAQGYAFLGKPPGQETVLAVLPFFHIYGATAVMLGSLAGAATLILHPRFDPPKVLDAIERYRPTMAPMVPFMFAAVVAELKKKSRAIEGLAICCSGASALDQNLRQEFEKLTGATIVEGYGLSEASPLLISNCPRRNQYGTVGLPVPDTEIRLVDIDTGDRDVPIGEVGELIARGPQIMQGYLNNPAETAIAIRNGWLYTGDLAVMDAEGFFKIVDRKKDMIISGGLNVYPSEIEPVISAHDDVEQCAVVGEPDLDWGERVVAWVVPKKGRTLDVDGIRESCRAVLAQYKIPREFRECSELPVSFLGKVRRVALRGQSTPPESNGSKN